MLLFAKRLLGLRLDWSFSISTLSLHFRLVALQFAQINERTHPRAWIETLIKLER
jgi:hypothetical protein